MKLGSFTKNRRATVPWIQLMTDQDDFIDKKYIPTTITLKDPSKLKQSEVMMILNHWNNRISANKVGFKFRRCLLGHSRVVSKKGKEIKRGVSRNKKKKTIDVNVFEE